MHVLKKNTKKFLDLIKISVLAQHLLPFKNSKDKSFFFVIIFIWAEIVTVFYFMTRMF